MKVFYNALFFCVLFLSYNSIFSQDEIRFFKGSFDQMTSQALSEDKPYIVFFTKEHCPPCDRMKEQTFSDPEVITLLTEKTLIFEAEMPDFDAMDLIEKFQVVAYPTMLFFSPKGVKIGEMIGGQSTTSLVTFLEKLN
ncbi:MAG: thioredoxin fold domain-containing protein [Bacteroidia bacterium]|nr:thioredoxin fold domain-containing protein [Bacteroidia bacterium]